MSFFVCRLDNHTLRQCYFSVTEDLDEDVDAHCGRDSAVLGGWDCDAHDVEFVALGEFPDRSLALEKARAFTAAREPVLDGFQVLVPRSF
jgi:hypothetical protein